MCLKRAATWNLRATFLQLYVSWHLHISFSRVFFLSVMIFLLYLLYSRVVSFICFLFHVTVFLVKSVAIAIHTVCWDVGGEVKYTCKVLVSIGWDRGHGGKNKAAHMLRDWERQKTHRKYLVGARCHVVGKERTHWKYEIEPFSRIRLLIFG